MKRKIAALFVLTLFIFSMVPFVMAQEAVARKDVRLEPLKISNNRAVLARGIKERHERLLNVRDRIRTTSTSMDIKSNIRALRDSQGDFDGDRSDKAAKIVEHLINHLELLIHHYEALNDRISASSELQDKYPNAMERIANAEEKITSYIQTLEATIEDGKVTREEWTNDVLPIIKEYGKQRSDLRSNKEYKDVRKAHVMNFAKKFREESTPKVRARLKARGLADSEIEQRVSRIHAELDRMGDADTTERMAALNRIRQEIA